jgi:hypothetical protein
VKIIRQIIADDITNAIECNRLTHAADLFRTLREFIGRHPDAADDLILD